MEWIEKNAVFLIGTVIIPLVAWFGSKRYFQAKDLKSKDIENDSGISEVLNKNLDLYQRMLDDIEERYENTLSKRDEEIKVLEGKAVDLDTEIKLLKEEIEDLEIKIAKLKVKINKLEDI